MTNTSNIVTSNLDPMTSASQYGMPNATRVKFELLNHNVPKPPKKKLFSGFLSGLLKAVSPFAFLAGPMGAVAGLSGMGAASLIDKGRANSAAREAASTPPPAPTVTPGLSGGSDTTLGLIASRNDAAAESVGQIRQ